MEIFMRVVLVASTLVHALPTAADTWQCAFATRNVCSPSGCSAMPPGDAFAIVDLGASIYQRCGGGKPCDRFPMVVRPSGLYWSLTFATGPQGAKMSGEGDLFIETVSLNDSVIVSFGKCERQ